MSHTCHAIGCSTTVPPKIFMCLKHWKMVPKVGQVDIWRHYVPGQERRKDPTSDYLKAAQRAQAMVLMKERGIDLKDAVTMTLAEYGVTEQSGGVRDEKN